MHSGSTVACLPQVFNRPAGEYAACYNWNGKGWVMAGTNITVSDGFSHFIVTPDPPTALQPMELQLLGNDFGAGDRYAFVSWKYETCDQGTPYPVTSAMFTEGNDRVVNVTGLTLEAGVWRLCYKFGTNDWMSSASNLTVCPGPGCAWCVACGTGGGGITVSCYM